MLHGQKKNYFVCQKFTFYEQEQKPQLIYLRHVVCFWNQAHKYGINISIVFSHVFLAGVSDLPQNSDLSFSETHHLSNKRSVRNSPEIPKGQEL